LANAAIPTLEFTFELDERAVYEIEQKGWFEQVAVRLPDGRLIPLCFWDPIRLSQELEMSVKSGGSCFAEPGMIIVPKVTLDSMRSAVEELYRVGYFNRLTSLGARSPGSSSSAMN
jgi:hypothetical protein